MEDLINEIKKDIQLCNEVIENNKLDKAKETLNFMFDAYYGEIKYLDQGINTYSYGGSSSEYMDDLKLLKRKLELYLPKLKYNSKEKDSFVKIENINKNENNNSNTNNIDIKLLFDNARKNIEYDESLSEDDINEIIEKINEIENIGNEDIPKNKKWTKLKGCMSWLTTKGVKVATNILPLITALIESNDK